MSRRNGLGFTLCFLLAGIAGESLPASEPPRLMQSPTLNRTSIGFALGGHLWSVPRGGGKARQLTSGEGVESDPHFSPDGTQLAYTGLTHGNLDVFVMPAEGGAARRLTYHPGPDQLLGWSPDGRRVLFRSLRSSYSFRFMRLFTVSREGGPETELPLPMANEGCFSPDGSRLAYVPTERKNGYFKRYRGGRTTPIWIARLSDSHITPIPHGNFTDCNPMWIGDRVYFLSDRGGPVTLFVYDLRTRRISRCIENRGFDLKSASAGPGAIVYEQFGSIHLYDLRSGRTQQVPVTVSGEFPELRERTVGVANVLQHARLSPSGDRVAFEARGEILTLDAGTGAARNLTASPGVMERDPIWSPDGKRVAYFSDESGEYALHLRSADGEGPVEKIDLGSPPSFYSSPRWSPDGARIAYTDRRHNLWYVDLASRKRVHAVRGESGISAPVWSPDSQWLAYSMPLQNRLGALFLYSLRDGRSAQITDGAADATAPAFDQSGGNLYFTANADAGWKRGGGLATSRGRSRRSVYVAPLGIDPIEIRRRIRPLPPPASRAPAPHDYAAVFPGHERSGGDTLLLLEQVAGSFFEPPAWAVHRFDLRTRQLDRLLERVSAFDLSSDGAKMLYRQGERWAVAATSSPPAEGMGTLPTDRLEVHVVPRAEWRQMFHEEWRIVRDFFYDRGCHGLDLRAAEARYAPFVEGLVSRSDLNALFLEMLGELSASHTSVHGGDIPAMKSLPGGLLGADYTTRNGRFSFTRIYTADPWDPTMSAPLAQPGAEVHAGEYLLAVNGTELTASDNLYRLFEGTANKPTALRVGPDPAGAGSREITVTPLADEISLRQWTWVEQNRRTVERLTHGRVAYIYVPDTLDDGFDRFNRQLYAQIEKEGVILDERFNLGGALPGAMVEALARAPLSLAASRDEGPTIDPPRIAGPKALIINEYAGSGGDALALYFRELHLGPLVGQRTWGGLAGAFDIPELMDGGIAEVPTVLIRGTGRQGEVENRGVAPDVTVEFDPEQVRKGHDPQLEAAVRAVMNLLHGRAAAANRRQGR